MLNKCGLIQVKIISNGLYHQKFWVNSREYSKPAIVFCVAFWRSSALFSPRIYHLWFYKDLKFGKERIVRSVWCGVVGWGGVGWSERYKKVKEKGRGKYPCTTFKYSFIPSCFEMLLVLINKYFFFTSKRTPCYFKKDGPSCHRWPIELSQTDYK